MYFKHIKRIFFLLTVDYTSTHLFYNELMYLYAYLCVCKISYYFFIRRFKLYIIASYLFLILLQTYVFIELNFTQKQLNVSL